MKPLDFFYFYRVLNWKHKISSIRPLGFALFGYTIAAELKPVPILANTLAVLGAILFCYTLNDFSDLKSKNEQSFMKTAIKEGLLTRRKALILCLLPLILAPFVLLTSKLPVFIFFLLLILSTVYSIPPALKKRRHLGTIISTVSAPLLFLESVTVLGKINLAILMQAALLTVFFFYLELIHILEDLQTGEQVKKVENLEFGLKLLKIIPVISLFISLIFTLYNPIFLITAVFSVIRLVSLKGLKPNGIFQARRNLFSPQLSLYEFALYALVAVTSHG